MCGTDCRNSTRGGSSEGRSVNGAGMHGCLPKAPKSDSEGGRAAVGAATPDRGFGLRPGAIKALPDNGVDRRIAVPDAIQIVIEPLPRAGLPCVKQRSYCDYWSESNETTGS